MLIPHIQGKGGPHGGRWIGMNLRHMELRAVGAAMLMQVVDLKTNTKPIMYLFTLRS